MDARYIFLNRECVAIDDHYCIAATRSCQFALIKQRIEVRGQDYAKSTQHHFPLILSRRLFLSLCDPPRAEKYPT